jgi:predicted dehydrogenase
MSDVRIGVIGLHNHYHAYPLGDYLHRGIEGAALVAVADERERYAREFAEAYGAEQWTTDYRDLLARDDIDALIVTSYTSAHAEQVEAAAEAGKHVLLDKPIATTLEDAARIVEAGREVKVMLAYLLRFLPPYLKAYQLVQSGAVGELVSAFYSIRVPASFIKDAPDAEGQGWYADPAKAGGGGFLDHAVHFTDFFRWFFVSEATSVVARIGNLSYPELGVDDYGIATYTLGCGAIATVESTWHAADWYGPMASPDRCTLTGTRGEIELHYQKSPQIEISSLDEPYRGRVYFDWAGEERYEICYRNILEEFVACVREDRAPQPDAEDGRKALEMVLAAYAADRDNRAVGFPDHEALYVK